MSLRPAKMVKRPLVIMTQPSAIMKYIRLALRGGVLCRNIARPSAVHPRPTTYKRRLEHRPTSSISGHTTPSDHSTPAVFPIWLNMGQWWQIINVDRRETSKHAGGELGTWFFYPHDHLLSHLTIPCLPKEVDDWLAEGPRHPPPGPISKLPIEAIDLLFDAIHGLQEVINFSITCKSLLVIGKRHILRATTEHYAPWAGCRLVSLGENTRRLDDLPPGLLTLAERREVETTDVPSLRDFGEYDRSLSNFTNEFYKRVFHMDWRMCLINYATRLSYELQRSLPPEDGQSRSRIRDAKMFTTLYGDGKRATYPEGVRVLCNLSKREYVREDGLTVPNYVNLAHALLARICWSSSPEVGMVCEGDFKDELIRGPWAGDRFCVTTLQLLPELEGEHRMPWKDVTHGVHELLSHIWHHNGLRWIIYCKSSI